MSGGGGGSGGFVPSKPIGKGQKKGGGDPRAISITLPLSAVDPKSASQLSVGEKLEVVLVEEKTADVVVAKDSKRGNTIVGSVAYSNVQELIDCLKEGNEYNATVRECSKTSVKVRISRA